MRKKVTLPGYAKHSTCPARPPSPGKACLPCCTTPVNTQWQQIFLRANICGSKSVSGSKYLWERWEDMHIVIEMQSLPCCTTPVKSQWEQQTVGAAFLFSATLTPPTSFITQTHSNIHPKICTVVSPTLSGAFAGCHGGGPALVSRPMSEINILCN